MSEAGKPDLTTLTVQLLSAYVGNNAVPNSDLAELIRATKAALAEEEKPAAPDEPEHVPAVSLEASLASPDHLISLIDGKPYKSLKRHLSTKRLTPAEYRARYKLPSDYPMVAPSYSEQRRQVAKQRGLGRKKAEPAAQPGTTGSIAAQVETSKGSTRTKAAASRKSSAKGASNSGRASRARGTLPAQ